MSTTMVVLARSARAEWSRIWTVRSSWVFAFVITAIVVGFGTIIGIAESGDSAQHAPGTTAWDGGALTGMFALFGILAMAAVTSAADHGTGGIVPTLQWTPRRGVLVAARAGVIVATTTVLAAILVTLASVMVWVSLPELGLPPAEGAEVLGGLGYIFATGALLAVGLGLVLRSTAGALVSVLALMLVLPFLLAQLSTRYEWLVDVAAAMPGSSALYLIFGEGPSDDMTTTSTRLTLAVWAITVFGIGAWRLMRTDANR